MPRAPLFPLEITPLPNSCTPEVPPEETLSVSDAVRSPVAEDSFTELASGFCLTPAKSKLSLLLSSLITDCCNDTTPISLDPIILLSLPSL
uniref:Uncharacterized protein n=1 Tax=Rhizophora mucronata TaxID=61149 RepID=A0A2P2N1D3_RHIMU